MGCYFKRLDRKINTWCSRTLALDTYGCGCQFNCDYCYARALLNFRGMWATRPKVSELSELHYIIKKLNQYNIVRIGFMTDCFQHIESELRITYDTIKLLNHYKVGYLIVTKSDLVANEEYIDIYDNNLAHFQISLTGTDEKILKHESAPHPLKRIAAIEKLYKCGYDVSVRLSPLIEHLIDFDIINRIECDKILIEFLKVNHWIRKQFDIDYSDYSLRYGGYDHLQLDKKIELVGRVDGYKQVSVGEYVRPHHEYFNSKVNHYKSDCCNISNKKRMTEKQLEIF